MPRPKSLSAPTAKKPAAGTTSSRGKGTASKRTRRSPYELVQELRAKRDKLRDTMEARLSKLDQRIESLEAKHEHKIKVSELLASRSPEELAKELDVLRTQQSLLRKALRQGTTR